MKRCNKKTPYMRGVLVMYSRDDWFRVLWVGTLALLVKACIAAGPYWREAALVNTLARPEIPAAVDTMLPTHR